MYKLFKLLILLVLYSCASSTTVLVQSNPTKAEVYMKPLGYGDLKKFGETPITIKGYEIDDQFNGSGPVYLEIRKVGHETARAIITELSAVDVDINLNLKPDEKFKDYERLDYIINSFFECRRLISVKRYSEALKILKKLESEFPQLSTIYELQGGIFYLQKKFKMSYESFEMAIKYNPKNIEAQRMRKYLKSLSNTGSKN